MHPEEWFAVTVTWDAPWTAADEEMLAVLTDAAGSCGGVEPGPCAFTAYFPVREAAERFTRAAGDADWSCGAQVEGIKAIARTDWMAPYREHFQPAEVSRQFWVAPPEAAAAAHLGPGQHLIRILPGMAFGTGTHETTRLVLALLDEFPPSGCRVLDAGAGSAILSIASVLLGASVPVVACEIDPVSEPNARENMELNAISPDAIDYRIGSLEALPSGTFDLLLCNMLETEFVPLLRPLRALATPGARLILSGYLGDDESRIAAALAGAGWQPVTTRTLGEWGALAAAAA